MTDTSKTNEPETQTLIVEGTCKRWRVPNAVTIQQDRSDPSSRGQLMVIGANGAVLLTVASHTWTAYYWATSEIESENTCPDAK